MNSIHIPIENDVWRCPRKLSQDKYNEWKREYPYCSGTEMAYINVVKTPKKHLM